MNKENQIEIKLYYKCKNKTVKEYSIDKNNITFGDILDIIKISKKIVININ